MFKWLIIKLISFFFRPLSCLVKKKNVVILQTSRRYLYNDNTRYLYENLCCEYRNNFFWVTDSKEIKLYLKKKNFKFISWSNPIKLIQTALKAKIVVDNGNSYFNPFGICDCSKVIKISLSHGIGPKSTVGGDSFSKKQKYIQIRDINKFDYVNFTSEYAKKIVGLEQFQINQKKLTVFGYPRCDQFFDKERNKLRLLQKKQTKKYFPNFCPEDKVLLYTPTWRPYVYDFPLNHMDNFNFKKFNEWLEENKILFFYSTHSNNAPKNFPVNLKRIIKIDHNLDPLFDINYFMQEVDVLINDYATTSTEFAILNRPQIFFMPDFEKYTNVKGFTENYKRIMPGKEVTNFQEFTETILNAIINTQNYISTYKSESSELLKKYYDKNNSNATKEI